MESGTVPNGLPSGAFRPLVGSNTGRWPNISSMRPACSRYPPASSGRATPFFHESVALSAAPLQHSSLRFRCSLLIDPGPA